MTEAAVSDRKRVVETYIEGFRRADHGMILACLTDDVAWDMPPYFSLSGKAAFDAAIENDATPGLPDIQLARLVEEGDIVVAEGAVQADLKAGGRIDVLFCDVFHFRGDKICRLVTYQVDRHPDDATRRAFEGEAGPSG
ncbi:MAG TPA: nuclear transport factor 2 family protein [Solirubrobacteraceae bacterium]|nr:nuclear transport factor 2 family protein [Solirubrobacteraceae bacterium]